MPAWETASPCALACQFFSVDVLHAMAACIMTYVGRAKHESGRPDYAEWTVTTDDLLQWLGARLYTLAFPQAGSVH
eukprot:97814-Pleurochrysis_carterae.AAC.1